MATTPIHIHRLGSASATDRLEPKTHYYDYEANFHHNGALVWPSAINPFPHTLAD